LQIRSSLGEDYEKSEFSDGILLSDGYDNKTVALKFKVLNDDILQQQEALASPTVQETTCLSRIKKLQDKKWLHFFTTL
jgi:hypothetical protein